MFWLYMDKGLWLASPKKICLTLLNVASIGIAAVLVGFRGLFTD